MLHVLNERKKRLEVEEGELKCNPFSKLLSDLPYLIVSLITSLAANSGNLLKTPVICQKKKKGDFLNSEPK